MRILSASGDARSSSTADAAPVSAGQLVRAGDGVLRSVTRRDEADPESPSGRAVDVQAAAEQRQPLADAE